MFSSKKAKELSIAPTNDLPLRSGSSGKGIRIGKLKVFLRENGCPSMKEKGLHQIIV